jgi:hypothetical protein
MPLVDNDVTKYHVTVVGWLTGLAVSLTVIISIITVVLFMLFDGEPVGTGVIPTVLCPADTTLQSDGSCLSQE